MNCKKCGSLVEAEAKFCPYCGERLVNEKEESHVYQDPFATYRSDDTHQQQYQYQQNYSKSASSNDIQYADDLEPKVLTSKNNKSLIGLILSIIAVPLCFVNSVIGVVTTIIGFILVIAGFKHTSKGMKIGSLMVSIFSLVIVFIASITMFVFSLEIKLDNGYRTTIGNYFKGAFFNGYYSDKVEDYWLSENNELFYLDDGNYYLYMDADHLTKDYFTGSYDIDYGYKYRDDTIFEDDDYYYYTLSTSDATTDLEDDYVPSVKNLLQGEIIVKIDKKNFKSVVLEFVEEKTSLDLVRY